MKNSKLVYKTDSLPRLLFEKSRDWCESSVSSLLSAPIVKEGDSNDVIVSDRVNITRLENSLWRITFQTSDRRGSETKLLQLFNQIKNNNDVSSAAFVPTQFFEHLKINDRRSLDIKTRISIGDLPRLLCNVGFYIRPKRMEKMVSQYEKFTKIDYLCDGPFGNVTVVHAPNNKDIKPTDGFKVNICGPMPCGTENPPNKQNFQNMKLDLAYALMPPLIFGSELVAGLNMELDRKPISNGLADFVSPLELFSITRENGIRRTSKKVRFRLERSTYNLRYTSHIGNNKVALNLKRMFMRQFGINLNLQEIPYQHYLDKQFDPTSFNLVIVSNTWPHPASWLAPSFFANEMNLNVRELFLQSMSATTTDLAAQAVIKGEEIFQADGFRLMPIAQIHGKLFSEFPFVHCSASGLFSKASFYEN